ncbi:tail fiber domain-containing protein [Limnobacter sp. MED105]|uniref:tail fiber domain-containing protein n=1 Tax=Limnobacter sp. MED105 TaxID=391597 RepID=UPI000156CD4A|nr:tail fiber domain-containing protein [Limnobacter sp. MED105]EDM85185.1 Putative membrane-anchored cell surface protein, haemagluttinin [Limnobacter sp. MED105]
MKKNNFKVSPISFKPKPIVVAVQHALPYLVALGLGAAVVSPAVGRSGDSAAAFTATQLIRQFTLKNTVAQVSQGMQGYVAEFNGVLRASEMGTLVSGYPVDMGSVPSSVNLPQRDGAGRPLGYCAWDNSASTSNSSFLAGQGVVNPLVYAVVSPGLNGSMETSCTYILANRRGLGDDYVQVTAPSQTSSKQFKSAVGTYAELTAMPGEEGDIRLVLESNKLYSYVGGAWQPVDASKFNDDSAANGAGALAYTTGKVTVADFQAASATITGALAGNAATFSGSVTADSFSGNGAALTDLNASNVSSGVLGAAFGGTGVDSSAAAQGSLLIGTGAGFALGAITAGDGIGVLNGAGSITISNTGVLSIAGTNNQVIASAMNGDVVLSLPQDIATTSTPTFAGAFFNGNIDVASISQAGVPATLAFQYASDTGSTFYAEPNLGLGTGALAGRKNAGNVAIGMDVLGRMATLGYYDESGTWNTGVGYQALYSNDYGDENTAVGYKSLYSNTTGYYNTAMGSQSLYFNSSGTSNTAVGYSALYYNTTGFSNVAVGSGALYLNSTGNYNTAVGYDALRNNTAIDNSAFGFNALRANTTGTDNVAIGKNTLLANTTGNENTSLGTASLYNATTASFNTALGSRALYRSTTGGSNVAIGHDAAYSGTTANNSVAIGRFAMRDITTGTGNVAVGSFALRGLTTGDSNLALGRTAGQANGGYGGLINPTTTGARNTFLGAYSGGEGALQLNYATALGVDSRVGTSDTVVLGALAINKTGTLLDDQIVIGSTARNDTFPNTKLYVEGNVNLNGDLYAANATFSGAVNFQGGVLIPTDQKLRFGGDFESSDSQFIYRSNLADDQTVMRVVIGDNPNTFGHPQADEFQIGQLSFDQTTYNPVFRVAGNGDVIANGSISATRLLLSDSAGGVAEPNVIIGVGAMVGAASGGGANTAIGINALNQNTSGFKNIAIGNIALFNNTLGNKNTGVGYGALFGNTTGSNNTAMGDGVAYNLTTGDNNTALGQVALFSTTSGYKNTAVGQIAMFYNSTGFENVALGSEAMYSNTTGYKNTAVGHQALFSNTDGIENVALGTNTLSGNTTGDYNTALGRWAGYSPYTGGAVNTVNANTTGSFNTFVGAFTLPSVATEIQYATAIGAGATVGTSNTLVLGRVSDVTVMGSSIDDLSGNRLQVTGNARFTGNVDVGSLSVLGVPATFAFSYASDTGSTFYAEPNLGLGTGALAGRKNAGNVAVGDGVLGQMATTGYGTESGTWNTGVGYQALYTNDYGDENTALGYKSLYSNTTGYYNTASGAWSLYFNTEGSFNTANGYYSLQANTTGDDNVAVGAYSLMANTTGSSNVAVGQFGLGRNTTGYYNTAMGDAALNGNTTGFYNTAIGAYAADTISTSAYVTSIGAFSMFRATASESVAVGTNTLYYSEGQYNTAVGNSTFGELRAGASNTALGHYAMPALTTGNTNIAIGHRSGNTITTGSRNILIGDLAGNGTLTSTSNIALGNSATIGDALSYAVTIGNDSSVTTSNTVVLGRTTDTAVIGATGDDGSGNKLQVTGGLRASGNVFLNTGDAANYTQLRDLRVMSSSNDAGWDHLRIRSAATTTTIDVGGAENGLVFRVGQGGSGGVGEQTYNTVLTLNPDQSAVFAGRVDVQSLYVNGEQVAPVNKANIDAALTYTSTAGAAFPQSSLALGLNALDADPRAGNVAVGEGVLTSLSPSAVSTDGIFNTGVGFNALTLNGTGSYNTAIGTYTLAANTTGYNNTAVGVYAMVNTSTGFDNTGVGRNALNLNTTGSRNNALGVNALYSNTTGAQNNAIGANAMFSNTTGSQNVALGDNALYTNNVGYQIVAIGQDALYNNTSGHQNIAIGFNSQRNTTTGYRNTAVGVNSLLNNTDGFENSAFGVNALLGNTSGDYNSAFGTNSLLTNTLGERNVAVGFNTLLSNTTGSNNVAVGANALLKNTSGNENTAVGDNALFENTTGHSNAAVGRGALNNNTTGYYNIAMGRNALLTNSTGYNNSALGYNSLIFNTTGYNNAAVGRNALQNNTTGLNNTALGTFSMFGSTTGFDNTAVGLNALYSNTTGNSNVSLGMNALFGNATGSYNTGLGRSSDVLSNNLNYASAIGAFARVTTSNTLVLGALGAGKDGVVSSVDDQVVIGSTSRNDTIANTVFHVAGVSNFSSKLYAAGGAQISTGQVLSLGPDSESTDRLSIYRFNPAFDESIFRIAIGDNVQTFGEPTADEFQVGRLNPDNSYNPVFRVAGNGDVIASGYMQATAFNVSSDRRLKTNIQVQDTGSVLSRLEQLQTYSYEYLANPNLGRRIGVIAQEIQNLFPEAVATRADGMMSVDYSALGAMAAMGVGQLSKQVKVLDKTVADQGQRITVLDDRVNQHDTRITSLESWRTDAGKRMDGMQNAIDLNIQKIAENAVAIQTNSVAIERLDDALFTLDGQVKNNSDLINNINSRWTKNFSESADGSLLTVNAVELKVSNFTAQQVRANSVYSQRLEAEMARIADLEVNNLRANSAVANTVQAEQLNTGSAQVYAGVGLPAVLFAAKSDGHYTVSTSALDGSYATATVIVNAGQAKVVSVASEGIELYAEGNQVKVIAAGKSIKASWIKMG